ncbi:unnamed protein product, partial [Urochloa humidicola]
VRRRRSSITASSAAAVAPSPPLPALPGVVLPRAKPPPHLRVGVAGLAAGVPLGRGGRRCCGGALVEGRRRWGRWCELWLGEVGAGAAVPPLTLPPFRCDDSVRGAAAAQLARAAVLLAAASADACAAVKLRAAGRSDLWRPGPPRSHGHSAIATLRCAETLMSSINICHRER